MSANVQSGGKPVEIERKYLIKIPNMSVLEAQPDYSKSYIEQIYIDDGGTVGCNRIRKRAFEDCVKYYKTHKEDIGAISRIEVEKEISEELYERLSKNILKGSVPIRKVRHCFTCGDLMFELDVYDFWSDRATLEAELESEEQTVELPSFIEVIADVSEDKSYSNYSLAFLEKK